MRTFKNRIMKKYMLIALGFGVLYACTPPLKSEEDFDKAIAEKNKSIRALETELKDLQKQKDSLFAKVEEKSLPKVYISKIKPANFASYVEVHGVIESDKNITVMPEMSGIIRQINVREGSIVRKGQRLAVVDTEILRNNIAELKKRLELAVEVFKKQENLRAKNVGTEMQYLEAKNNKESLEQSIKTLESQVSKSVIVSPINGKIDEIYPNIGEMTSPQSPFARIVNTNDVFVNADVSEAFFGKVNKGDKVRIRFPYQKDTIDAPIDYVGNYINPNNRTFKIHANLSNVGKKLAPNLLAVLRLTKSFVQNAIVAPSNVIVNDGEHDYVMVVEKGKAVKKIVQIGESYQNETVIVKGLKAGENLVYKGFKGLVDGAEVEIKK